MQLLGYAGLPKNLKFRTEITKKPGQLLHVK